MLVGLDGSLLVCACFLCLLFLLVDLCLQGSDLSRVVGHGSLVDISSLVDLGDSGRSVGELLVDIGEVDHHLVVGGGVGLVDLIVVGTDGLRDE